MATRTTPISSGNAITPTVSPEDGVRLLKTLLQKAEALRDKPNLESDDQEPWINLARDYLTRAFGPRNPNISSVLFSTGEGSMYSGMSREEVQEYYRSGFRAKIKLLESCIEQLQTDIDLRSNAASQPRRNDSTPNTNSNKVFLVHGHDHGTKEMVARQLERLGLKPIILHEQPGQGRTIIEKFTDYADVSFAVVIMTPDDEGKPRGSSEMRLRARQNVVMELGFFLGRLGRSRVCVLFSDDIEIPSDYSGVQYEKLDSNQSWRFALVTELKAAGFEIDANLIFVAD